MTRTTRTWTVFLAAALAAAALACGGEEAGDADGTTPDADGTRATAVPADATCESLAALPADTMQAQGDGLRTLQVEEGEGRAAASGDTVVAHYLGCLTDGEEFDASYDRGEPISFVLGTGRVIPGWDRGLEGLRPGGVRILRIPPELGYGSRGTPEGPIPPDATLLFQVEMVEVRPGG